MLSYIKFSKLYLFIIITFFLNFSSTLSIAHEIKPSILDFNYDGSYLNIEIRLADVRSQLQTAKSNVQNASNYLSFLMDDITDVVFIPVDSLAITSSIAEVQKISENRADIKAMELASKAHEQLNKADKMAFLPRLNLFGSYQMYDNNIFDGGADGYLIGAELSWDIFQGSKRFAKAFQCQRNDI